MKEISHAEVKQKIVAKRFPLTLIFKSSDWQISIKLGHFTKSFFVFDIIQMGKSRLYFDFKRKRDFLIFPKTSLKSLFLGRKFPTKVCIISTSRFKETHKEGSLLRKSQENQYKGKKEA